MNQLHSPTVEKRTAMGVLFPTVLNTLALQYCVMSCVTSKQPNAPAQHHNNTSQQRITKTHHNNTTTQQYNITTTHKLIHTITKLCKNDKPDISIPSYKSNIQKTHCCRQESYKTRNREAGRADCVNTWQGTAPTHRYMLVNNQASSDVHLVTL